MAATTKWRPPCGTDTATASPETKAAVKPAEDVVNHPNHYAPNGRDSFMCMKDQMGTDAFDGFLQGNVIKYVQRYKFKGKPVEDLTKAAFYLFHLAFEAADHGNRVALRQHLMETLEHASEHFGCNVGGYS